jgi:hypothetical protein
MQLGARQPRPARIALWELVAGYMALFLLSGCTSGTLSGMQHSCQSNLGVLDANKVSCSGSVDTVRGSPSLSVIEVGEDLDGAFRLEASLEVGQGTAKAYVVEVDDKRVGGEVSPGNPLQIVAVVYPEQVGGADDEGAKVDVQLEVAEGEEVRDLQYEATLVTEEN